MKVYLIVIFFFFSFGSIVYGYNDNDSNKNPDRPWFEAGDRILKNYYDMEKKRKEKFENARKRQIEYMIKHAEEKRKKIKTESDDESYKFNLTDTGNCVSLPS